MIKTDLSGFVVTLHSGLCEQYIKPLSLSASEFYTCFTYALVQYDNKPLQNWSQSLKNNHSHHFPQTPLKHL